MPITPEQINLIDDEKVMISTLNFLKPSSYIYGRPVISLNPNAVYDTYYDYKFTSNGLFVIFDKYVSAYDHGTVYPYIYLIRVDAMATIVYNKELNPVYNSAGLTKKLNFDQVVQYLLECAKEGTYNDNAPFNYFLLRISPDWLSPDIIRINKIDNKIIDYQMRQLDYAVESYVNTKRCHGYLDSADIYGVPAHFYEKSGLKNLCPEIEPIVSKYILDFSNRIEMNTDSIPIGGV